MWARGAVAAAAAGRRSSGTRRRGAGREGSASHRRRRRPAPARTRGWWERVGVGVRGGLWVKYVGEEGWGWGRRVMTARCHGRLGGVCEGLGGVGGLRVAVCRRRAGGWVLSRRQEQSPDTSSHRQMQYACVCGRLEGVDPQPEVEQSREGRVGAVFAESVHWREAVAVLQCVPKQGR